MKINKKKIAYNFDDVGVFTVATNIQEDPLINGHYPQPAKSLLEKPEAPKNGNEMHCDGEKWVERLKKTKSPSKYHKWDSQKGWEISESDQISLDIDIQIDNDDKQALAAAELELEERNKTNRKAAIDKMKLSGNVPNNFEEE